METICTYHVCNLFGISLTVDCVEWINSEMVLEECKRVSDSAISVKQNKTEQKCQFVSIDVFFIDRISYKNQNEKKE